MVNLFGVGLVGKAQRRWISGKMIAGASMKTLFGSPEPTHNNSSGMVCTANPSVGKMETDGSLLLTFQHTYQTCEVLSHKGRWGCP